MSIVRSLVKASERLEKKQNIQATEETSPDNNEETLANSLQEPRNDHLAKSSKQRKEGGPYFLVDSIK